MSLLLRISGLIDRMNSVIGRWSYWLILIMVLISAGNALVRYGLNTSSNAWLEIQWYLFSAVFLLCAGQTLLRNDHIRIDVISARFSRRTQAWIDIIGGIMFLMPMAWLILSLSWPVFLSALASGETSSDAGGLIRWPARLLIPAGFLLLLLQGFSETVKRAAFLMGLAPDPLDGYQGNHGEQAHG